MDILGKYNLWEWLNIKILIIKCIIVFNEL
jgi:hypothetical protein